MDFAETLLKMGFVEQLAALLQHEHGLHCEHLAGTLATLVTQSAAACKECQRPELHLRATLEERLSTLTGQEDCQEEREHCALILRTCFKEALAEAPETDR